MLSSHSGDATLTIVLVAQVSSSSLSSYQRAGCIASPVISLWRAEDVHRKVEHIGFIVCTDPGTSLYTRKARRERENMYCDSMLCRFDRICESVFCPHAAVSSRRPANPPSLVVLARCIIGLRSRVSATLSERRRMSDSRNPAKESHRRSLD